MSRFALLRHYVAAAATPANDGTPANAPSLNGVERAGQVGWAGAGNWSGSPNLYEYAWNADGAAVSNVPVNDNGTASTPATPYYRTATDAIEFTWPASMVDHAPTLFVRASADNGATWSAAVQAIDNSSPRSDLITPATRSLSGSRTSGSGTLPMVASFTGPFYYGDKLRIDYKESGVLQGTSVIVINETMLANLAVSMADAFPAFGSPTGAASYDFRLTTADYAEGQFGITSGVVSGTVSLSVT